MTIHAVTGTLILTNFTVEDDTFSYFCEASSVANSNTMVSNSSFIIVGTINGSNGEEWSLYPATDSYS